MKKIYLQQAICFTSLAMMFSCSSEDLAEGYRDKQITMTGHDFRYDTGSRTSFEVTDKGVGFKWAANDTVGIIPDEGAQVYFPMMDGAGTQTAAFNGGGWALKPSSSYAAYYPFVKNYDINKKALPIDFTGQKQIGTASTTHLGKHDIMTAVATTPADGSVNFDFQHLGSLIAMDLVVPKAGDVGSVLLSADEELFTDKGVVDLTAQSPQITPVQRSRTIAIELENIVTSKDGEQITVYFMMAPGDYTGKPIKLSVINNAVKYTGSIAINKLSAGVAYNYKASLAGQKPIDNNYYITKPGTLREIIGEENMYNITELTVSGKINQDDLGFIAQMAGRRNWSGEQRKGKLVKLNLAEASIVNSYDPKGNDILFNDVFNYSILTDVILPKGLKVIGASAFANCQNLKDIDLPIGLNEIGNDAFLGCTSFESMSIPESVNVLGSNIFSECTHLTNLVLPKNLKSIPVGLVSRCTALLKFDIPVGVTSIGGSAFAECTGLKGITIPSGVTSIGGTAFAGCTGLSAFDLPKGLTEIENGVFERCTGITELVLSENITSIGNRAFYECSGLTSIKLPNSLTSIGYEAFSFCGGITTLELSSNVSYIGNGAFSNCRGLESIKIPDKIEYIENRTFYECSGIKEIILSESLKTIGEYAFWGCNNISNIIIPSNVSDIDETAFINCSSLRSIKVKSRIKILPQGFISGANHCREVYLSSTIVDIRGNALPESLGELYCFSTIPPALYPNNVRLGCKIYVPKEAVDSYKAADKWKEFADYIFAIPDGITE